MSRLHYYELPNNISFGAEIPITFDETPLALINFYTGSTEAVSLSAVVGWRASGTVSKTRIRYTVWRGAPYTGTSVCSFIDSCESNFDKYKVSNLAHIDTGFNSNEYTTYVLTAQLLEPNSAASVIGGLTFTASEQQLQ